MIDLNANRHVRPLPNAAQHSRHGSLARIRIEAHVAIAGASLGGDRRPLDGERRRTGYRQLAEVHQVPIGHLPVFGRVLGHWGDHDTIGEIQVADSCRREQDWLTHNDFVR